jgi:hypothetical protein
MKKVFIFFATIALFAITGQNVIAQNATTGSADASATIIAPLAIVKDVDLRFGNIASGAAAGSVVLSTNGIRTPSNVILPSVTGTYSAAQFTVSGLIGATYEITLPASTTISNGSVSMTIDNFIHDATEVLNGGSETFNVGATLNLDAGQDAGAYTGTFNVTVDYN